MENENEIQKVEAASPLANAAALVAADGNMNIEKLGKLLELQERYEATQAKKAFTQAMAAFKAKPPEIIKDKTVGYKEVKYSHASLSNVTTKINTELSKHGLTASWVTSQDNGSVKVICRITHVMGHSEETCLSAPPDSTGSKNVIQAIGSTVTYLQRYTLLALTGLATADQDDDGAGAGRKLKKELPKLTGKNKKALEAIYVILRKSVPNGKQLDEKKVAAIFLAQKGYPEHVNRAEIAALWIRSLGQMNAWTKKLTVEAENVESDASRDELLPPEPEPEEPKALRYYCNDCSNEADGLTPKGLCRKCQRNNIIDREAKTK